MGHGDGLTNGALLPSHTRGSIHTMAAMRLLPMNTNVLVVLGFDVRIVTNTHDLSHSSELIDRAVTVPVYLMPVPRTLKSQDTRISVVNVSSCDKVWRPELAADVRLVSVAKVRSSSLIVGHPFVACVGRLPA
jgi:DNA-binding transcriptional regulator LsrR (DeoR family)